MAKALKKEVTATASAEIIDRVSGEVAAATPEIIRQALVEGH